MLIKCRWLIKCWSVGFVIYVTPIYICIYIYIYIYPFDIIFCGSTAYVAPRQRPVTVTYILYYTVLYCIPPNRTALHRSARYDTMRHYTTLHYTTLHYTTLHYTTLHYTTLHYTTPHHTTPHHTTLHYTNTTPHHTTPHTTPHHTTPHYTTYVCTCMHITTLHSCMCDIPESPTNIVSWCDSQFNTVQIYFYFSSKYKYIMI